MTDLLERGNSANCHGEMPTWLIFVMLAVVLFDEFIARVKRRPRPMRVNQSREAEAIYLDQPEVIS